MLSFGYTVGSFFKYLDLRGIVSQNPHAVQVQKLRGSESRGLQTDIERNSVGSAWGFCEIPNLSENVTRQLEVIKKLLDDGVLTEEEYNKTKKVLL